MPTAEKLIIESMFQIANKSKEDVPFILNSTQTRLDHQLGLRNLIPKARQEGVTTYILARFTIKCLTRRNTRAVVISHDKESTQRMFTHVHYYLENIRGPKAIIQYATKSALSFPKTGSIFYIGTAGARKFGRGDTITDFHGSEVAYWDNPQELVGGALQAVPWNTGEVFLESTGNGAGTWFHKTVMRAFRKESRYNLHFFNWISFKEYCVPLNPKQELDIMQSLQEEFEEPELVKNYGLTAGQILWRRYKLEEMDYDMPLFKQEYPTTLDECFRASGGAYFHKLKYVPTKDWQLFEPHWYNLQGHPNPNFHYTVGGDVGAGVQKDYSVAEIFCLETGEQVGEYANNRVEPDVFGKKLIDIGTFYNFAYLTVESNNHGAVTLQELRRIDPKTEKSAYPANLVHRDDILHDRLVDMGYRTTSRSRPIALGALRKKLTHDLILHSEDLRNECTTFVENENGKLEASQGCFDDRVMAAAMAVVGMPQAELFAQTGLSAPKRLPSEFSLEAIIEEMRTSRNQYPVESQTGF